MTSSTTITVEEATAAPSAVGALKWVGTALLAVGIFCSLGAMPDAGDRVRFAFGYLWGFTFIWGIVLGSLFFVGLLHLTHATWSVVMRRVFELFASPMEGVAVLFVPVLLFVFLPNLTPVYPWTDASIVEQSHLLQGKQPYLNAPFFAVRAAIYFAAWIYFSRFFVRTSLSQDTGGSGIESTLAMRRRAAPWMMVFAVTTTFASFDWLMSLDPYWFSTMFGVYVFSGMVLSALAVVTITTVRLRGPARLMSELASPDHLYNLGLLLFVFSCFWAYIAFSQYMLIWYANMPEETSYIWRRLQGGWFEASVWLAMVRFVVPFFVLLSRRAKKNPMVLLWVSWLVLAGQLLDLYWLVMPELHPEGPVLGWQELGPPLALGGALLLAVSQFLGRTPIAAIGDPLLEESRAFHL